MKLIWTILIHIAVFLVLLAITLCILNATLWNSGNVTLDGFKNHQLIQLSPSTDLDIENIVVLQNRLSLIPWTNVLRKGWPFMLQVPPNQTKQFTLMTEALHLPFVLLSTNLENQLNNQKRVVTDFKLEKSSDFDLNRYHYFKDIEEYLRLLSNETNKLVLDSYGTSIENRQLYDVRIFKPIDEASSNESEKSAENEKKSVIIECGAHAREWLSPASCLHYINYLINDADSQSLLDNYEFRIIPIVNPDGYAYSWTKDRMWRKNRRRFADNNCYGVDLNRNFNVGFNSSEIPEHIHMIKHLDELGLDFSNKTRFRRFTKNGTEESTQCSNLYGGRRL